MERLRAVLLALLALPALGAIELVDDQRYRFLVERYEASLERWRETPVGVAFRLELASACFDARMYWRGAEVLQEVVAEHPDWPQAWSNLSVHYGKMGMYAEAIAAIDRRMQLDPEDVMHARLVKASWLLKQGDAVAAQALVDGTPPPEDPQRLAFYHSCLACYQADAGDQERLREHIDRALALGAEATFFRRDIVFDPYRGEPWFIERFGVTLVTPASE